MVKDLGIDPGPDNILGTADDDPLVSSEPSQLTAVNGVLFFSAEDFELGRELFKSDGTVDGTVMVSDLNPNGSSYPYDLTSFNNQLFFSAETLDNNVPERHVYRSDGSTIDFVADTTQGGGDSNPTNFEVVGNDLFFASNGVNPVTSVSAPIPEITAENSEQSTGFAGLVAGTTSASAGTISTFGNSRTFTILAQCCSEDGPGWVNANALPGTAGVQLSNIEVNDLYVAQIGGGELDENFWEWTIEDLGGLTNISFTGFASGNQMDNEANEGLVFELFVNDSTTRTSFIEIDGSVDQSPQPGPKNGDALDNWYGARDDMNLSLTDPGGATITKATIRMSMGIIDNNGNFQERLPDGGSEAFLVNATLQADVGPNTSNFTDAGRELHKIDAATLTAELVKDIVPVGSSAPTDLKAVGGQLFFEADDVTGTGKELWVSDGTEAGTMLVIDSLPGNDLYGAPTRWQPDAAGGRSETTSSSRPPTPIGIGSCGSVTAPR